MAVGVVRCIGQVAQPKPGHLVAVALSVQQRPIAQVLLARKALRALVPARATTTAQLAAAAVQVAWVAVLRATPAAQVAWV
jgi:hypothetical protein